MYVDRYQWWGCGSWSGGKVIKNKIEGIVLVFGFVLGGLYRVLF